MGSVAAIGYAGPYVASGILGITSFVYANVFGYVAYGITAISATFIIRGIMRGAGGAGNDISAVGRYFKLRIWNRKSHDEAKTEAFVLNEMWRSVATCFGVLTLTSYLVYSFYNKKKEGQKRNFYFDIGVFGVSVGLICVGRWRQICSVWSTFRSWYNSFSSNAGGATNLMSLFGITPSEELNEHLGSVIGKNLPDLKPCQRRNCENVNIGTGFCQTHSDEERKNYDKKLNEARDLVKAPSIGQVLLSKGKEKGKKDEDKMKPKLSDEEENKLDFVKGTNLEDEIAASQSLTSWIKAPDPVAKKVYEVRFWLNKRVPSVKCPRCDKKFSINQCIDHVRVEHIGKDLNIPINYTGSKLETIMLTDIINVVCGEAVLVETALYREYVVQTKDLEVVEKIKVIVPEKDYSSYEFVEDNIVKYSLYVVAVAVLLAGVVLGFLYFKGDSKDDKKSQKPVKGKVIGKAIQAPAKKKMKNEGEETDHAGGQPAYGGGDSDNDGGFNLQDVDNDDLFDDRAVRYYIDVDDTVHDVMPDVKKDKTDPNRLKLSKDADNMFNKDGLKESTDIKVLDEKQFCPHLAVRRNCSNQNCSYNHNGTFDIKQITQFIKDNGLACQYRDCYQKATCPFKHKGPGVKHKEMICPTVKTEGICDKDFCMYSHVMIGKKWEARTGNPDISWDVLSNTHSAVFPVSTDGKKPTYNGFNTTNGFYTVCHMNGEYSEGVFIHTGDKVINIKKMKLVGQNAFGQLHLCSGNELDSLPKLKGISTREWNQFAGKNYFLAFKVPKARVTTGKIIACNNKAIGLGTAASEDGVCGSPWVLEDGTIIGVHIMGDLSKGHNGCLRLNSPSGGQ